MDILEEKGDPHCVLLIHLCLANQLFLGGHYVREGYRKLYCPFPFKQEVAFGRK